MTADSWQPIETAPKDGTPFFVWGFGFEWPEVIRWFEYPPDEVAEIGEPGYFHFAETTMQDYCDAPDVGVEFTHWQPLLDAPK